MLRAAVDQITGTLSEARKRYLGTKAITMHRITIKGENAMIALSSRPWLCYNYMGQYTATPLSYDPLTYATSFTSEQTQDQAV